MDESRQKLLDALTAEVAQYGRLGKRNYFAGFALKLATVLASITAGALGLFEARVPPQFIGIVALVPAGAALASRELQFQAKANHYFRWMARFREIRGLVEYSEEPNDNTGRLSWLREQANIEETAEWERQFGSSEHRPPPHER